MFKKPVPILQIVLSLDAGCYDPPESRFHLFALWISQTPCQRFIYGKDLSEHGL